MHQRTEIGRGSSRSVKFAAVHRAHDHTAAAGTASDRRRTRRLEAGRRGVARRRRLALLVPLMLAAVIGAVVVASLQPTQHRAARRPARDHATHSAAARPTVRPAVPVNAAPPPGSLPQTDAYPSGTSAQFRSLMSALWAGVVTDSLRRALPAFFPEGAYVQLKAIVSASSDWTDRLVHDYGLDIASAHALLGRGPSAARLITVEVAKSFGHWIAPGICYNRIGYYEMPNARVVYREDGQVRSFGIASMISWRGVWYVVHFGAILRAGDSGTVDDPGIGPGTSVYSATC